MPAWNPFSYWQTGQTGRHVPGFGWVQAPGPHGTAVPTKPQIENPWQEQYKSLLSGLQNRYGGQYDQMAAKAMALGNRDYTGYLTRQAREGWQEQARLYQDRLRNMGMPELWLKEDVQKDFAKRRQDMMTEAAMQGQNMTRAAYETAMGMLRGASGADLDSILARLQAIQGGSSNYNQFMQMLIPLMEKLGMYYGGPRGGGNAQTLANQT